MLGDEPDEYDDSEVAESVGGSASDVFMTAQFVEHADRKVPLGQPVDLLVGFFNKVGDFQGVHMCMCACALGQRGVSRTSPHGLFFVVFRRATPT